MLIFLAFSVVCAKLATAEAITAPDFSTVAGDFLTRYGPAPQWNYVRPHKQHLSR